MNMFETGAAQALRWVKVNRKKREYELRAGAASVATLVWTKHSQAMAEWGGRQYHFHGKGWLHPHTDVSEETAPPTSDEHAPAIATYTQHTGGVTFEDGHSLMWQRPSRRSKERVWLGSDSTELMRFTPAGADIVVSLQSGAGALPETPLLLLLGAFLIALAEEAKEDATVAAVAAVIASS